MASTWRSAEIEVSLSGRISMAKQCVQGVAYLHALRPMVLHQDIKPANIMIDKQNLMAKLCDMGIARVRSLTAATMTNGGSFGGSPAY
jgi:serine/threonine protein kinase